MARQGGAIRLRFRSAEGGLTANGESLAGFLIEITGNIPKKGQEAKFKHYIFTVESADNRKIKRVKVTI